MKETKARFYERRYSGEALYSPADQVRLKIILSLIGTGRKVLDIGCYSGVVSSLIAKNGNDVYGVDLSEPSVELAKKKGIKAYVIDAEHILPFPADFFDTVFAGEIIEHIFDTDRVLEEIKRVLKPDGHLVLTTPNLASLGRRLLLFLGKNPLTETSLSDNAAGHIRYFIKETLFKLLIAHKLVITDYMSDVVNFDNSGRHFSRRLAKTFPTLGKTIIVKAQNKKIKRKISSVKVKRY